MSLSVYSCGCGSVVKETITTHDRGNRQGFLDSSDCEDVAELEAAEKMLLKKTEGKEK